MDVLKKLPDKSVNMVFGDPDYNVGVEYGEKTYTKNFIVIIYRIICYAKEKHRRTP